MGVFFSNKEEKVKSQFFAMLLSALNSFAEEISEAGLSNFEVNNNKYNILKKNGLLFVANSDKNIKKKNILKELEAVSENFFNTYGEDFIEKWDGNTDHCANFEENLERILPKQIRRIAEGLGWTYKV